jgi:MFS family permease
MVGRPSACSQEITHPNAQPTPALLRAPLRHSLSSLDSHPHSVPDHSFRPYQRCRIRSLLRVDARLYSRFDMSYVGVRTGIVFSVAGISNLIGNPVAGKIVESHGYTAAKVWAGCCCMRVGSAILVWMVLGKKKSSASPTWVNGILCGHPEDAERTASFLLSAPPLNLPADVEILRSK